MNAPTPLPGWLLQSGYECRLEWGRRGARLAAARGDILVVVDTLRFSSAAAAAASHGVVVYPCASRAEAAEAAARVGGVCADGRFSLSPLSYDGAEAGTRVALASPNGATCCRLGSAGPAVFVGALVNARVVSLAVSREMDRTGAGVTVLACGERWPEESEDGELRPAVEDGLGAGTIVACLGCTKSPEALVWQAAFAGVRDRLPEVLRECASGRQLVDLGRAGDIAYCARLDACEAVPVLRGEALSALA